ncbi:hypothetical protein TRIP_B200294 [uncultured Desulfatiglans sp.]|uniref:Uncharacterized protein n=1 Tax=Uncultured Desulfatiglans sp. TaxID=1748965 RepID=A0A653A2C1_UNCDX|nr:hypothetical protein TRIP_B200294 [uncultured Desulfatiglans sp.]
METGFYREIISGRPLTRVHPEMTIFSSHPSGAQSHRCQVGRGFHNTDEIQHLLGSGL